MGSPRDGVEPTVLLVGAGERFTPAFQAALGRHRVFVETADLLSVVDAVVVTAPDLVLLMGDAARDGGASVLEKLKALSQNFSVPVVVLNDDAELDAKLTAFQHGAAAVLPRSASVDATAEQVARLARDIPEQGTGSEGGLGEATLDEFVNVLSKRLREGLASGLLPDGVDGEELRLVLGQGRPLVEFVDGFVRRVRRHVVRAEPLRYELDASGAQENARGIAREFKRLCVLLADDDAPRADAVAQELRARGVTVVVTDLDPSEGRFQALRQSDPTVLLIGENHAHGSGYALLRRLRKDSRLRWASLLVVRWEDVWPEQRGAPAIQRFEATLAALAEPERALIARAELGAPFETRLEATGPARCLRALSSSGRALRVHVEHPRVSLAIDLSDGLVVGAEGRTLELQPREFAGVSALSALSVLGSGLVRIQAVDQPATANVMTPVEVALNMADAETPPISPSIPAAGAVSLPPTHKATTPDAPPTSLRPSPVVSVGAPPRAGPPRPGLTGAPVVAVSSPPPTSAPTPPPVPPSPLPPAAAPAAFGPASVPPPTPASLSSSPPAPRTFSPRAIPPTIGAPRSTPPAAAHAPPSTSRSDANPPAMTLTPALDPDPRAPMVSELRPHTKNRGFVNAATAWLAKQDAKLHGKRIAGSTAAVLVGLGVVQGLLIVTLYAGARGVFSRASGATAARAIESARPAAPPSAARPAETALAALPTPAAPASAAPAAMEASGSAIASASAAPSSAQAPAGAEAPAAGTAVATGSTGDGSDHPAPSCSELVAETPPKSGVDQAAAIPEMRASRAAIVRGDLRAAQSALCRAAHFDPQKGEIALQLTHVLLLVRDGKQAVEWANRAVQQLPRQKKAKEALGDALARVGSDAEARDAWFESAGIDASNEPGRRALVNRELKEADRTLRARDYVGAERFYRRVAVLEPQSVSAAAGLSYVLTQLGDAGAAVLWARRAVAAAPRSAAAHFALGEALDKADDRAAAVAEWREAATIDPSHREAARRLRAADASPH